MQREGNGMPQGAEEGTAAQPAPGLSAIPGGKVFISYASQDTDTATQLLKKWGLIT